MTDRADAPWYEAEGGLRFTCTQCGDCCTGEPGAVWVNQDEIDALADYLGMDAAAFERQYVRKKGVRRSLHERFDGDCILFDKQTRGCSVYPARPVQCRTWPFWHRNLVTPARWDETCRECPGSGTGELIGVNRIRHHVEQTRAARRKG